MDFGSSNISGVYKGHHRPYTSEGPQYELIPHGDRDRVWAVNVYGSELQEDRGFIDHDKYTKYLHDAKKLSD